MVELSKEKLEDWYLHNYEDKLKGRYITQTDVWPLINNLNGDFKIREIGSSYQGKTIRSIEYGVGKIKILLWSQMHGNESTGTKALFDLFRFLQNPKRLKENKEFIQNHCTLLFVPILNPDGAEVYTRVNAQEIDLNRDVLDQKAPESKLLMEVLNSFQPEYCFNLHDQRTIFSVGQQNFPATLSFLAPSIDEERTINEGRIETMRVISGIYDFLRTIVPDQIGRYTDEFYPTATGDNFQKAGYNTILIESGHFIGDYSRETSRMHTFFAILQGILIIAKGLKDTDYHLYFTIPDNQKNFLDIIFKNIKYQDSITNLGFLYQEQLENGKIKFVPKLEMNGKLDGFNANTIIQEMNLNFNELDDVLTYIKKNVSI